MKRLQGKTAVVTGGSSGIGKAIAEKYASHGANVAICDINLDGAKAAADHIKSTGANAMAVEMDVSSEGAVNKGIKSVADEWGRIDILLSNAGVQIINPVEAFSYADWKKMMAIHLDGAFLTTKACVNYMYPEKQGSLIYMGSVHSHEASPLKSAYVAAKHGILGLARVMAKEGAKHNVRANVICPGFVKTPLVEKQIPEQARDLGISEDEVINRVMLGNTVDQEFTTMEDVAEVALMLAEFKTNALTGQSIIVSHGWGMK